MMRNDTNNEYPFVWLDDLVETTLNPDKADVGALAPDFFQAVGERLPLELDSISARAKTQAFSVYSNEHLKVMAGHYDLSVHLLLQQAEANLVKYPDKGLLRSTGELIINGLAGLAQNLQRRYGEHITVRPVKKPAALFKMLLKLSGDQVGILIRGAFDAGLIDALSKRAAFKALTPFLSTEIREHLSSDSLRSNSGRPERRDVDKVVEVLGVLSKMVSEYR